MNISFSAHHSFLQEEVKLIERKVTIALFTLIPSPCCKRKKMLLMPSGNSEKSVFDVVERQCRKLCLREEEKAVIRFLWPLTSEVIL